MSYHQPHEFHNHVILTIESDDSKTFVIDLAGSQFGIFGYDAFRPHVVCEELEIWKHRFSSIAECVSVFSYPGKINLMKRISNCFAEVALQEITHRKYTSTKRISMSDADFNIASEAANSAMAQLLLEENEEKAPAAASTPKKYDQNKILKKKKKGKKVGK